MSIIIIERSKKVKVKNKRGQIINVKRWIDMGMSDRIEAFINELLKDDTDEWLELRRNELANVFGCVPSQINYVISTRFTPEHGYIVESRRGGGGYLRIKHMRLGDELIGQTIGAVGNSIDEKKSRAYLENLLRANVVDKKTAEVMMSAISDSALNIKQPERDYIRASIFKNMLAAAGK
jgi:transcriptional regulator CtsR